MVETLIASVVVFVLATFLGVELIGRVPPTLHTPLMSGANAVSGITVVGALIVAGGGHGWISTVFGFVAIVCAMMNVAGGYAVTDRMLAMFRSRADEAPAAGGNGAGPAGGAR
jgi:NAD(P) transhydrogenase subunit alpha